ncbi:MAG: FAD binding domain-containing protein [Chloroflexota bacterium]
MTTLAPFELHRVTTVAEATAALEELGDEAVLYAGGTELLLLMKLGFASYAHLVDIKPVAELGGIAVVDGALHIGGGVPHRTIERSPVVRAGWPALAAMERWVANIRVRNVGTIGGNLAFADPHSDPATFLLAADASVVLGRGDERRTIPMADLILGPYTTALEPGELLVRVEVPALAAGAALSHLRFAFHERPAVTVSTYARVAGGTIAEARVAIGSVGVRPIRVPAAEAVLTGLAATDLDPAALLAAGEAAAEASEPEADANGSADYKAHLVSVLVGRAFRESVAGTGPAAQAA